jgi:NAD(P)-dependent dehydrogenase (short-subunit alcohol dehydrogenase family)
MERDMLEGQRVVVFGGLSGIGLSTARLALAYGAVVTVASRTRARLEAAKVKLGDVKSQPSTLRSDTTRRGVRLKIQPPK